MINDSKLKRTVSKILIFSLISVFVSSNHALAIENGTDATGNSIAVPIKIQLSPTNTAECTGALIAPSIVVTAGHCVLDQSGLVTKSIYVGKAGSSMNSVTTDDTIQSVEITSSFSDGANNTVGSDDLAFLTLTNPQTLAHPVTLASESQMLKLQQSNAPLTIIGYGNYHDATNDDVTNPNSLQGTFSQTTSNLPNSAYMSSTTGDICQGDSGSPVISTTATQITIVGIVTGAKLNIHCTQKQSSGNYLSLFTLIGRYSNLAFSAATDRMTLQDSLSESLQKQIDSLKAELSQLNLDSMNLQNQLDSANTNVSDLQDQLDQANQTILTLKKKLPMTISCSKGKVTKKVTGILPSCPTGFTSTK